MNTTGKQARRTSGMNRHQIKRATRVKRIEHMKDYNPNVGTNARHKVSK